MQRVWNLSDDPRLSRPACTLMLFGRSVRPGSYVLVPDDLLENARKIKNDLRAGVVYVGHQPPTDYLAAKQHVHARVSARHNRAHGATVRERAPEAIRAVEQAVDQAVASMTTEQDVKPRRKRRE